MINNNNLEQYFLDDVVQGRNIITCGTIGSGKSYNLVHYLYYSLKNNQYEEYHLVIPQFKSEQNDSYSFLTDYKDRVFIYKDYHELIIDKVDTLRYKKKVFFVIDDATGEVDFMQKKLIKMMTTCRHGKGITTWLLGHIGKFMRPAIREVTSFIFITNILGEKMMKNIYEEFLSMYYKHRNGNIDNFFEDYRNMKEEYDYPQMVLCRKMNGDIDIDFTVSTWKYLQVNIEKKKSKKVEKKAIEDNKYNPLNRKAGVFYF